MRGLRTKSALTALVMITARMECAPSYAQSAGPQGQVSARSKAAPQDSTAAAPSSILGPLSRVEQRAHEPISITYENGQLSIDASNAVLSDILRAVCSRTGALIDIPQGANERVTRQIGPGRVIQVLGSLLNESEFNYLIEELGAGQGAPVRVTLSSRLGSSHEQRSIVGAENIRITMATAIQREPGEPDPREQAFAERGQLLRQIMSDRGQFMVENIKDKSAQ